MSIATLCALGSCAGELRQEHAPAEVASWSRALGDQPDVVFMPAPAHGDALVPRDAGLVIVDLEWRLPDHELSPAQRRSLLRFVDNGGRVVLFGHAARVVCQLGIEPEQPECTVFRWGFDARAASGRALLGLHVVSGKLPALFDDVAADAAQPERHWLAGGTPCTAPLCAWSIGAPRAGEVLARTAVEQDGEDQPLGAPVLVQWSRGRGAVLACGVLPDLDHADRTVRDAAAAFVRHCVDWARSRRGVVVWSEAPRGAVEPSFADAPPAAPLLAHWGWQIPLHGAGTERSPREVLDDVTLPAWRAGADLCNVELADADGAVPLLWPAGDPLKPAPSFVAAKAATWNRGALRGLAAEAHARGMLLLGALDPAPAGTSTAERLAMLRFVARELACTRSGIGTAFDGFSLRNWLPDAAGWSLAMVQDFQPAALLCRAGECANDLAGGERALDADDGSPRGSALAGVDATWRDGFAADLFPLGVLDARVLPDAGHRGGGSHGDWIVAQANSFVRERRGLGGAMWWRRHDPSTLGPDTVAYVHGVSSEPLRAAVATSLAATGSDGVRAAAASLLDEKPAGFGASVDAPAAVHVLQNNWFRLLGSGGGLLFDPRGLARFDGDALVVSPAFLRTRLFGGRPDGDALRNESVDLLAAGRRGEGGWAHSARCDALGSELPPALLAYCGAPAWPAAATFEWKATTGCHELELVPRGVQGRGILTIALDGTLLRAVPFVEGNAAEPVLVPVHVATAGTRCLQLEVIQGGAVAIDRLQLHRAGDVGVEAHADVPAGSRAVLAEQSSSSLHAERVELCTIADFPGFVLRVQCDRAARNLQVERTIALPHHRQLVATTSGERPDELRAPFLLRSARSDVPDLVIAPLRLSRYEHFRVRDGAIVWRSAPEHGASSRAGVLLCAHGDGERWLPHAARMLEAAVEPLAIHAGDDAEVAVADDLPLPWTRVVHVDDAPATPFFVREQGWWQWRATQPAPDGGAWLRVQHTPGDVVCVVGGPAVLARTRPGPGSLRLLALRDVEPRSAVVRVLQPSLLSPPSIVMGDDFDDVEIDGRRWSCFDGRTVFLPGRVGTFAVVVARRSGSAAPHVRSTRAPLSACEWSPRERELVLATAGAPGRPAELPWTAVLAGPVPASIDNGEVVDDATLHLRDAEQQALARQGGVLIRFRNGVTRIHYRD